MKKIFLSKEIKAVLSILDELCYEFDTHLSFEMVKKQAEKMVLANKSKLKEIMIKNNISPKRTAYSWINNVSGDMLESGEYHIYRGTLNQIGDELLKIFDISTDELVKLGDMDKERAYKQKENIRENMKSIG